MISRLLSGSLLAFTLLLTPQSGHAWGVIGHWAVGDIAEWHLTPKALDQVHLLLADEGWEHLDQVASWPDVIRPQRKETGPWHYVSIPLTEDRYLPERDCVKDDCVIGAINRFRLVLADRSQPVAVRCEALKFLVHFIGDLQMPLHAAENAGDHGGNDVIVQYFDVTTSYDGKRPMNLHSLWDIAILERHLGVKEAPLTDSNAAAKGAATQFAVRLNDQIMKEGAGTPSTDPVVWAMESHELARKVVYPGITSPGVAAPSQAVKLGQDYDAKAWPVVQNRIKQGGLRLAAVLNQALDPR
jgi:hypothetical protein